MPDPHSADTVLDFWFGPPTVPDHGNPRPEWFRKDAAFDQAIRERFGDLHEEAMRGRLDDWDRTPRSLLARIIVLDQFSRNLHRDRPQAFASDAMALADARAMVARAWDGELPHVGRWFVYLPYEHSENAEDQETCVALMRALSVDPLFAGALDYALRHQAVILRFGRFPHRNAILGRASTAEEAAFLLEPGSSF